MIPFSLIATGTIKTELNVREHRLLLPNNSKMTGLRMQMSTAFREKKNRHADYDRVRPIERLKQTDRCVNVEIES